MVMVALMAAAVAPITTAAQTRRAGIWNQRDIERFESKVRWGVRERLDTLPLGEAIARVGLSFVGTPYQAQSLEQPGPERVVVNLRGLDCVTFVETVLALTRIIRHDGAALLKDRAGARARYERYLRELRYRGGVVDGYASRLHYFTEWLLEGERSGRLRLLTGELGGIPTWQVIDFMSTHRASYPALRDGAQLLRVVEAERALSAAGPFATLPKGWITELVAREIRSGDIIAATAAIPGLDVVHTGFGIWRNGALHLLHAPLAGGNVEVSERPLAERLLRIRRQSGIAVARPLDPN
jgi:hypothetical protein